LGVYLSGPIPGDQRRVGAAAARGAALEGRRVPVGRAAGRRFRNLAPARSGRRRHSVFDAGWLVSQSPDRQRRVRVPVLVTLGVRADGDRVILDVRLVGDESTAAWRDVIQSLVARQIGLPTLAVIDGNPGLAAALREQWPTLAIHAAPRTSCATWKRRPRPPPRRTRRRVSADDLRRQQHRGGPGARPLPQEVAASLPRGRRVPR